MVLTFSHNYIKIKTKLQNNHCLELPEWKSYHYRIKEEATLRQIGGAEAWNRLVPYSHVADKNCEGYLGCRDPSEE